MIAVACITFGHSPQDVEACLASALLLATENDEFQVLTLDDCSGARPCPPGIPSYDTPSRRGFPGAVQYLIDELAPGCSRLILINPDATVEADTLELLARSTCDVAVPTIRSRSRTGKVENVRFATTAMREVANLLFGERVPEYPVSARDTPRTFTCPPFAPSGAVISIDAQMLRETPLDPSMFWLEFSDWVRRRESEGRRTTLEVVAGEATHSGASTSVKFPVSVAASQARAKVAFIRSYGGLGARMLVVPAVTSRALRFALRKRSLSNGLFILRAALGRVSWKVNA